MSIDSSGYYLIEHTILGTMGCRPDGASVDEGINQWPCCGET
jgi:hypothetical protein